MHLSIAVNGSTLHSECCGIEIYLVCPHSNLSGNYLRGSLPESWSGMDKLLSL